jgi:Mg/Co/Ni transporter MgtE
MIRMLEIIVSVLALIAAGSFFVARRQQSKDYATWMSAEHNLSAAREEFETWQRRSCWLGVLEIICYFTGFVVTRLISPHTMIDVGCLAAVSIGMVVVTMTAHHFGRDDTETQLGRRVRPRL